MHMYIGDWACKNQLCGCKLHLVIFFEYLLFQNEYLLAEDSPLHSTLGVLILYNSYTDLKLNFRQFFALTWLIFAGLVTYIHTYISPRNNSWPFFNEF